MNLYGNGSDGDRTFDGTSTVLGLIPVSGTYSLARDLYLDNGTVNSGVIIAARNFRIFAKTSFVNNGTVHCDGNSAVNSAGGAALPAGTFGSREVLCHQPIRGQDGGPSQRPSCHHNFFLFQVIRTKEGEEKDRKDYQGTSRGN